MGITAQGSGCIGTGNLKRNLGAGDQRGVRVLYPGDNILIKAPPSPDIYVTRTYLGPPSDDDETGKRHIPNPVSFEAYGFSWGDVLTTTSSFINAFPAGNVMENLMSDGVLLKGSGPEYYVMQGNNKRHIAGPPVMTACGYGSDQVYTISNTQLNSINTGSQLTGPPCPKFVPPQRSLIKGTADNIYVIDQSKKRWITSPVVFVNCGYKWGNVTTFPDTYLSNIQTGSNVNGPPCP